MLITKLVGFLSAIIDFTLIASKVGLIMGNIYAIL